MSSHKNPAFDTPIVYMIERKGKIEDNEELTSSCVSVTNVSKFKLQAKSTITINDLNDYQIVTSTPRDINQHKNQKSTPRSMSTKSILEQINNAWL
jgi:hypothetical protein